MERILDDHAHHVPAEHVMEFLGVEPHRGLDLFEVARRRERFGANTLTERKGASPVVQFLLQFRQPLVYILVASAVVTAVLKEVVDAVVIFGVVLINAIVGFLQEAKALRAINALSRGLTSTATVLRGGERVGIPAGDLVPGDIVVLQSGDRVPADLRLVTARDLQIDESALTGEPVPAPKGTSALPRETPLADRGNMAFSSTLVTYGVGTGVVVSVGDATEVGRISELIASAPTLETPLTRRIHHFSNILLIVILGLAAASFGVGVLYGEPAIEMFKAAVALAVGAIPEGLPSAVTIIMAIGVSRMAARRAIIRSLPAVETLGSTTVICTDKTGTLTQNQMTVRRVLAGEEVFDVTGSGYAPAGEIRARGAVSNPAGFSPLVECLRCGLLCADAELSESGGLWRVQGDPTEGALIASARKGGLTSAEARSAFPRLDAIPFESERQYMATLHDQGPQKPRVVYLKGSVESILGRCGSALGTHGETAVDSVAVMRETDAMAAEGLRVLAFARTELPAGRNDLRPEDAAHGLVFIGLQGMMDPPRPEAAAAVAACQRAGIRVKMITGDHAVTAASIARQIGIHGAGGPGTEPAVLTSRDLAQLSDREFIKEAEDTAVFARVSPEDKLRLVQALQAKDNVVAMTGDGVNDAPALRTADIGVAMALGGTEVAREAADMILTDDNFASIEAAVEEGRGVFDNLRKFIVWTLPTNIGEAIVILAAIFLGISLPILPVQILWINMATAVFLGMSLAFEPKERGIMDRPPSDPLARLLDSALLQRIVVVAALLAGGAFGIYEWELAHGAPQAQARTAAVAMIVIGELFYLFNCRSFSRSLLSVGVFSNPLVWMGSALMVGAQLAFTYLPLFNRLFQTEAMRIEAWGFVLGLAVAIFLVVGMEKWFRARVISRKGPRAAASA
jgi:cation-transporting ATPase F